MAASSTTRALVVEEADGTRTTLSEAEIVRVAEGEYQVTPVPGSTVTRDLPSGVKMVVYIPLESPVWGSLRGRE